MLINFFCVDFINEITSQALEMQTATLFPFPVILPLLRKQISTFPKICTVCVISAVGHDEIMGLYSYSCFWFQGLLRHQLCILQYMT